MILALPESERDRILVHAKACTPKECCGFLLGRRHEDLLWVEEALPALNIAPGRDRYRIAPEVVLEADLLSRRRGLEVIAVYHSHPETDAFPSEVDRAEAIRGTVHLIVGGGHEPELRAFAFHKTSELFPVPIRSLTGAPA